MGKIYMWGQVYDEPGNPQTDNEVAQELAEYYLAENRRLEAERDRLRGIIARMDEARAADSGRSYGSELESDIRAALEGR
jgi:hypothetical protein